MPRPDELLNAASLVSLAVLCVLLLRRLVRMERFQTLRVLLLAAPLWLAVLYLFCLAYPHSPAFECPESDDPNVQYFCISEY